MLLHCVADRRELKRTVPGIVSRGLMPSEQSDLYRPRVNSAYDHKIYQKFNRRSRRHPRGALHRQA